MRKNYGGKNLAKRGKGIDNLLQRTSYKRNNDAFKQLNSAIKAQRDEDFNTYNSIHFVNFKANLRYIQTCSGLNQEEFTAIANINRNALSEVNQFPTTIPIHSFLKCYSMMRYYLPAIEFCDMFLVRFETIFPYLKDNYSPNRIKLGKKLIKSKQF